MFRQTLPINVKQLGLIKSLLGSLFLLLVAGHANAQELQTSVSEWKVVEQMRLGTADSPHESFTEIVDLAVDSGGNIYVLQSTKNTVASFTADGRHRYSFGGAGEGPSEFRRPQRVGVHGDSIWVLDPVLGRLTWFSAENGELLNVIKYSPLYDENQRLIHPISSLERDTWLATTTVGGSAVARGYTKRLPLLGVDLTHGIRDTVGWRSVEGTIARVRFPGGGVRIAKNPFVKSTLYSVSDNHKRIAIVNSVQERSSTPEAKIAIVAQTGDTLGNLTIERGLDPVTMDDARERLASYYHGSLYERRGIPTSTFVESHLEVMEVPRWPPVVESVVPGPNGTFWLETNPVLSSKERAWLVVDDELQITNWVKVPEEASIMAIDGNYVWATERGPYDIPQVVRYTLARSDDHD